MDLLKVKKMSEFVENGEKPDILFWVGSAGSFDERAQKITRAFVTILNKCNVNFAVLGEEESSSGDAAKRAGNEFLFQMQALMNIEILNSYDVRRIVTTCPHSYNTIKNEYKGLGKEILFVVGLVEHKCLKRLRRELMKLTLLELKKRLILNQI